MSEKLTPAIAAGRAFMRSAFGQPETQSDQQKKLPQPPLTNPAKSNVRIALTKDFGNVLVKRDIEEIIAGRVSHRFYGTSPVTLEQLAFLLWATQGVRGIRGNNYAALRTVPSGGGRHAFETYLAVANVAGLTPGLYHYLPLEHALEPVRTEGGIATPAIPFKDMPAIAAYCACDQKWVAGAAVTFIYTAVAYRAEWRYADKAHRPLLIDAGHVVQNLYLACEATGLGTCAIAAFRQAETDAFLKVDGEGEYTVYLSPVGVQDKAKNLSGNNALYADIQK